jgi:hypothetical protein
MGSGTFVYRLIEDGHTTYTEDEKFVQTVIAVTRSWPDDEGPPLKVEYAYHKGWEDYEPEG